MALYATIQTRLQTAAESGNISSVGFVVEKEGFAGMGSSLRTILAALAVCALLSAADAPSFEKTVAPVLTATCTPCHNDSMASGNLVIAPFTKASIPYRESRWTGTSFLQAARRRDAAQGHSAARRDWMAPSSYLQGEFEKADRNIKPDPGRVTARRLNRTEYSNTIRDLLGVEFHAEKNFPTDDSGNGFDNIGDVLTISPVLMEKYLAAARTHRLARPRRRPAARSRSRFEYHAKDKTDPPRRLQHHRGHPPHRVRRRVHRPLRAARRARAKTPSR